MGADAIGETAHGARSARPRTVAARVRIAITSGARCRDGLADRGGHSRAAVCQCVPRVW
jgi:hypothetical protein